MNPGALVYLQWHSMRNRTVHRVKRLKQPKYLVGALVGLAWFWLYFIRPMGQAYGGMPEQFSWRGNPVTWELLAALGLFLIIMLNWIVPRDRASLTFSEAEVNFLFPAPITRRGLIHFKLLKSQLSIFFSVLIFTLLSRRLGGSYVTHAFGWWVLLSTLNLHFLGASFVRTRLMDRGITPWYWRLVILGLVAVLIAGAVLWGRSAYPDLPQFSLSHPEEMADYLHQLVGTGPLYVALWPIRLVLKPHFAQSTSEFLRALLPALAVMVAHYLWVIRSNVAFEEASVEASQALARKIAAAKSGDWNAAAKKYKVIKPPFVLKPAGAPFVALLWKNLISSRSVIRLRLIVFIGIMLAFVFMTVGSDLKRGGVAAVGAMLLLMGFIWTLMLGPQFLRQDFRQDLVMAEVLKTLPVPAWQMALGQTLTPAFIMSVIHWLVLGIGLPLAIVHAPTLKMTPGLILSLGFSAALIMPLLNLLAIQIPNLAVLLFPAWFHSGKDHPGGIEAMGQRLIILAGQVIAFMLALIPASIAFSICFFLLRRFLGDAPAVLVGAIFASLALAAEALAGIFLIGKLFTRFDLSLESDN